MSPPHSPHSSTDTPSPILPNQDGSSKQKQQQQIQYFLPPGSCDAAQALLEHPELLTEQDVFDFVRHNKLPAQKKQALIMDAYHERRREIRDLAWKVWEGQAFVDEDGRLVPAVLRENQQQQQQQEGEGGDGHLPNNVGINNNNNDIAQPDRLIPPNDNDIININNNNGNLNNLINPHMMIVNNNNIPFPLDQEEEERRWTQEEEREAAAAIARALARYRQEGVPEDDIVLLRVPPMERPERASLTFRRICFAVLAVVTAFICIMLQTIPLFPRDNQPNPLFDKLLYELLNVRHFTEHAQACPHLHRSPPLRASYKSSFFQWFSFQQQPSKNNNSVVDCSDGVVHIPTKTVLEDAHFESYHTQAEQDEGQAPSFWESYFNRVNVSWFLPCHPPPNITTTLCPSKITTTNPTTADSCPDPALKDDRQKHKCFRGIHDNMVHYGQVAKAWKLGGDLIEAGGDHFDIHTNVRPLEEQLPTLLDTIRQLLHTTYRVPLQQEDNKVLVPVAFRVSAVGPLDGGPLLHPNSVYSHLMRLLNRQNYFRWVEKHKRHNELARYTYSLPWPSARLDPFRDPCVLMADLEADPRFAIHTDVFLSDGAGQDFRGGVSLYVDDHPSNSNPRRKIQRGVTIDGSQGRLVVSTGGLENRRCRLPTREGVRASLQIWWNYSDGTNASTTYAAGEESTTSDYPVEDDATEGRQDKSEQSSLLGV